MMSKIASGSLKEADHFSEPVHSTSASASSMRAAHRAELWALCTRGACVNEYAAASAGARSSSGGVREHNMCRVCVRARQSLLADETCADPNPNML